jgi:Zinc knuckle
MDTGAQACTPGWQGRGNWHAQGQAVQIDTQVPTRQPLICFGCSKSGHVVALCPNQDYGCAAQQGVQQAQFTCFNCGKKGHMAHNCMQRKCAVANIMDAEEEPLDYPVEQGDRVQQIKSYLNTLTLEEQGHLADELGPNEDFPNV